ncbi:hypothetical protein Mrose_02034 [Calidithermus roseus]|uniref:Uncharacterized protein n=1 Tax=Calidithermus roseus TaxID=1644118 RepID=A0A399EQJ1_9DEIN|nr:hypothetical protein Mrose_02034 [Calidithermus roseus]
MLTFRILSLALVMALSGWVVATHTAARIFDIAREALENDDSGLTLVQTVSFLFSEEEDSFTYSFETLKDTDYKIIVVTDEEVMQDVDVEMAYENGEAIFKESDPDTTQVEHEFTSDGGVVEITLTAAKMPDSDGYAAILILEDY